MISVIVPIYKVEKYLSRCIDSLCTQTYKDIEIILVDDGSPDNCGRICDEFSKRDERVIVIHQDNKGLSMARNAALEIAKGQYIAFADSDDFIHPCMYETMLNAIEKTGADIAICHELAFDEGEEIPDTDITGDIQCVEDRDELVGHFADDFTGPIFWVWNKLYRKELIQGNRFKNMALEDVMFNSEILINAKKAVWVPDRLYYYFQRPGSTMKAHDSNVYKDYGYAFYHISQVVKTDVPEQLKNKIITCMMKKLALIETETWILKEKDADVTVREYFTRLYKEEGKNIASCSDKIKIRMAYYCLPLFHLIKKKNLVKTNIS